MKKYLARRILALVPVLAVVSIVIFMLIHLTPGDPAAAMLGDEASPEEIQALRESLGLNEPLIVQYWKWLTGVAHGDLGKSLFIKGSMAKILGERLVPTLQLTLYSVILAAAVSVPLGVLSALKRNTAVDQAVSALSIAGISLPSFLLGIAIMYVFAVKLRWIPSSGYRAISEFGLGEHLRYMIAPSISLGLIEAALMTRMTRSSMLEIINSDYIRMAKAKGVPQRRIFWRHALKNASIGISTVIGLSFMSLLAGATVTETIFGIPGIGQLTIVSVTRRDYEVIQAIVLLVSVMNVLIMLLMDILYAALDPRVRLAD